MLVWMFATLGRQGQNLNGHVQVVNPVYMKPSVAFSYYKFLSPRLHPDSVISQLMITIFMTHSQV